MPRARVQGQNLNSNFSSEQVTLGSSGWAGWLRMSESLVALATVSSESWTDRFLEDIWESNQVSFGGLALLMVASGGLLLKW